jgi:hypothetical protein
MNYAELNALPPETFLHPERFVTEYDGVKNEAYRKQQYTKGLEQGKRACCIWIAANGTWGADTLEGGFISSYEGIGYHAGTADLLRGFLDSGCQVKVYRNARSTYQTETIIREATVK